MYIDTTRENVTYKNNLYFRIMRNHAPVDYPSHWHTAIELIMPLENSYIVEFPEASIQLEPHDILLIPSGMLHSLIAPPTGSRLILQIDYSMLAEFEEFAPLLCHLQNSLLITGETMPKLHPELSALLLSLKEEYFSPVLLKESSAYATLLRFFIILGREVLYQKEAFSLTDISSKKRQEYIEKFFSTMSYINLHCTENPTIEELAALAGFSVSHFARLFRNFTGMTWYNYLNRQKIAHVERLLASTSLPITEIALLSGFNSLATFNRVFKLEKNCTPSQYKDKYRF